MSASTSSLQLLQNTMLALLRDDLNAKPPQPLGCCRYCPTVQ